MSDLLNRLTSRKFLLTLAACIYYIAIGDTETVKFLVGGYLAAEGLIDTAEKYRGE